MTMDIIYEDHSGELFEEKCPHCESLGLLDIPTRNLTLKVQCVDCGYITFYKALDRKITRVFIGKGFKFPEPVQKMIDALTPEQKMNLRNLQWRRR